MKFYPSASYLAVTSPILGYFTHPWIFRPNILIDFALICDSQNLFNPEVTDDPISDHTAPSCGSHNL